MVLMLIKKVVLTVRKNKDYSIRIDSKGERTMKLWSKEALLLGGLYSVLDVLSSLLPLDFIPDILFVLFIVFALMLCFNKIPKFIPYISNKYPKFSFYMCSIGWIPYAVIILFVFISATFVAFRFDESLFLNIILNLADLWFFAVFVSLIAAFYKWKKQEQK